MKAVGKERTAFLLGLILLMVILPEAFAADTIYQPTGYRNYNGSSQGYIMSYDVTTPANRQYLRVAFSVGRPAYAIGDVVQTMVRTDGYFFADSGWWYIVKNASVNITYFYPNNTQFLALTAQRTNDFGIWENFTVLMLNENYPMGRYRARAGVRGPATGSPGGGNVDLSGVVVGDDSSGNFLTVYFDVGGDLNVTLSPLSGRGKNQNISINGTVYQPNGQVFNSTFVQGVPGFSSYPINITVQRPDNVIDRYTITTSTGSYSLNYNTTMVGSYSVTSYVDYQLGNQAVRGKYSMGRVVDTFVVYGKWPETGLGFNQSILSLASLLPFLYLQRRRGGGS